jgi:hypothetical protein
MFSARTINWVLHTQGLATCLPVMRSIAAHLFHLQDHMVIHDHCFVLVCAVDHLTTPCTLSTNSEECSDQTLGFLIRSASEPLEPNCIKEYFM